MVIWILWAVAWAVVYMGRDWRLVPLLYAVLLGVSVLAVAPLQNDLAAFNLARPSWEDIVTGHALLHLPWAGVALIVWFFRRRRRGED